MSAVLGRQEESIAPQASAQVVHDAIRASGPIKLNLGCGSRHLEGFVNVDLYGDCDVRHDLETFPWPWEASSVGEVLLNHVLEHLGQDPRVFISIMKELYRVCAPGARVQIVVPHPRHDNFLGDPTHVRPVTHQVLSLFDRQQCEAWKAAGYANTPLALHHGVDFRIVEHQRVPAEPHRTKFMEGLLTGDELMVLERECNNVIEELRFSLEVVK